MKTPLGLAAKLRRRAGCQRLPTGIHPAGASAAGAAPPSCRDL